jgi:hypothetical protein
MGGSRAWGVGEGLSTHRYEHNARLRVLMNTIMNIRGP